MEGPSMLSVTVSWELLKQTFQALGECCGCYLLPPSTFSSAGSHLLHASFQLKDEAFFSLMCCFEGSFDSIPNPNPKINVSDALCRSFLSICPAFMSASDEHRSVFFFFFLLIGVQIARHLRDSCEKKVVMNLFRLSPCSWLTVFTAAFMSS